MKYKPSLKMNKRVNNTERKREREREHEERTKRWFHPGSRFQRNAN